MPGRLAGPGAGGCFRFRCGARRLDSFVREHYNLCGRLLVGPNHPRICTPRSPFNPCSRFLRPRTGGGRNDWNETFGVREPAPPDQLYPQAGSRRDSPQRGFSTESVSTLCRGAWQSSDPLRNTSIGIIPWLSRDAPAAVDSLVRQGVVGDGRQCMNASRTGLAR